MFLVNSWVVSETQFVNRLILYLLLAIDTVFTAGYRSCCVTLPMQCSLITKS